MPHEIAAICSRSGEARMMSLVFIQIRQSCSATQAPVMAAVLVPPSAWITSQSMMICRSPSASRFTTARRLRPISRWISMVRPFCLPAEASRRVRSSVARGSMPYSAVIQPRAWPLSQGGNRSSRVAVTNTWVSPNFTKQEPSAYLTTPRSSDTARSSSGCRRLGRIRLAPLRSGAHDIPIGATPVSLAALNERSREIFRQIVESYLATGEPVGSRNLSRLLPITLSPASVRNVMSDLEQLGLIYAPHTSAGRLPTELGLRFFVDALMEIGDITEDERRSIEAQVAASGHGKSVEVVLTEASALLSGLTRSAGIVLAVKTNPRLKHIEFVRLEPERALVVLVAEDGQVENRVVNLPKG